MCVCFPNVGNLNHRPRLLLGAAAPTWGPVPRPRPSARDARLRGCGHGGGQMSLNRAVLHTMLYTCVFHICIHIHIHTCIYIYIHLHMHIFVYLCSILIYTYIDKERERERERARERVRATPCVSIYTLNACSRRDLGSNTEKSTKTQCKIGVPWILAVSVQWYWSS